MRINLKKRLTYGAKNKKCPAILLDWENISMTEPISRVQGKKLSKGILIEDDIIT